MELTNRGAKLTRLLERLPRLPALLIALPFVGVAVLCTAATLIFKGVIILHLNSRHADPNYSDDSSSGSASFSAS